MKNALRLREPDSNNYSAVDLTYKKPITFLFDRQLDRLDQTESNKELTKEYKNRLELGDYSAFKVKDMPDLDIGKFEERDAVSFL